jgi:DNA sulfur modification protein DndB
MKRSKPEIADSFSYVFSALRGFQAGRDYYVAMCPLKLIPKIFLFDEDEIPAELRAQRALNKARVPEIARYLIDNPKEYVFSSITASIVGEVQFDPGREHDNGFAPARRYRRSSQGSSRTGR